MVTIKAHCPMCATDRLLSPGQVVVKLSDPDASQYGFRCDNCHVPVVKPAPGRVIALLVEADVEMLVDSDPWPWDRPAHPEGVPSGLADLSEADIDEFAAWLDACDDVAAAARD